ncbi:MAG: hypothetical protein AAGD34_13610 [Pseudomonadota bacterium]
MSDRLAIVLDRLIPGDPERGWPTPSAIDLAAKARALADGRGEPTLLDAIAARLPDGFEAMPEADQVAALSHLEAGDGEAFGRLIHYAYGAYYIDPAVRRTVEVRTGYPARPPQPQGYTLPPFDEALLETVKTRPPFWRPVPKR